VQYILVQFVLGRSSIVNSSRKVSVVGAVWYAIDVDVLPTWAHSQGEILVEPRQCSKPAM